MASLLDLHNLQAEVARRCGRAGIAVKFDMNCKVPYASRDGVVFPAMSKDVTDAEYRTLCAAAIHEPLHVIRSEVFDLMEKDALPMDHPLSGIANAFEDDVMERIHCREYPGDFLDLSKQVYAMVGRLLDQGQTAHVPSPEEAKFRAAFLCYLNSRAKWDRISGSLLGAFEGIQHPETMAEYQKLLDADIPKRLQTVSRPADVREIAKEAYRLLYPENDLEEEIKQAQKEQKEQRAKEAKEGKGKPGKASGAGKGEKGDKDKDGKPGGGFEKIETIKWDELSPSGTHDHMLDAEGEGFNIDYTGCPHGEWTMTPPDNINEVVANERSGNDIILKDRVADASLANQIRRAIQSKMRVTKLPERKFGKINSSAVHRIALPMRGDGDWNTRIFKRKTDVSEVNTAVSLLIDGSGSMHGEKVQLACTAAARFAHLFGTVLHVPVEVLSFTSHGDSIRHMIVKGFHERLAEGALSRRLGNIADRMGGNADADALLWCASRLAVRREPRKIMIVLSDGSPTDAYNHGCADTGLRRVTKELSKRKDMELFGIGICTNTVSRYYGKNARIISDPNNLNKVLLETLEECIVKYIDVE